MELDIKEEIVKVNDIYDQKKLMVFEFNQRPDQMKKPPLFYFYSCVHSYTNGVELIGLRSEEKKNTARVGKFSNSTLWILNILRFYPCSNENSRIKLIYIGH